MLLGMFWKRATRHAAFIGLVSGTVAAFVHYGVTLPKGATSWVKGGWFMDPPTHIYPSELAQAFWTAIYAFSTTLIVTIVVSIVTKPREEKELVGLVYSLTERPKDDSGPWYTRPVTVGIIVLILVIALNFLFA